MKKEKTEFEGGWFWTTFLTLLLSHSGYFITLLIVFFKGLNVSDSFNAYLSQGSIITSGITLIVSAFVRKVDREDMPNLNKKCVSVISKIAYIIIFIQGLFYGVVYSTSNFLVTLTEDQKKISIVFYIITILILFIFNYFNRSEKSYNEQKEEVLSQFGEKSKEDMNEGGINFG